MKPSDWAVQRFGENAEAVAREVPRALTRAHNYAAEAQAHSGTKKQDPYGHTLKNTQHEQFAAGLGALPGARLFRPKGASYFLVQFAERRTLLYPWRYANSLAEPRESARMRVSEFRSDLLGTTQGERDQLALDQAALTDEQLAKQLADDEALMRAVRDLSHIVLVPYASNERGLLGCGLGAAELLNAKGDLDWRHYEPIVLGDAGEVFDNASGDLGPDGAPRRPPLRSVPAHGTGAFDGTPLDDDLGISARLMPEEAPSLEKTADLSSTADGVGDGPASP